MIAAVLLAPAALAGPVFFAVTGLDGRGAPALVLRDGVERLCVFGAALFCAACTLVQLVAVVLFTGVPAHVCFAVLAPPVIGAAPWVTGELLSGRSRRQDESFAASLCAAYLVSICISFAPWANPGAALLFGAANAALASSTAYLCTRGATPAR